MALLSAIMDGVGQEDPHAGSRRVAEEEAGLLCQDVSTIMWANIRRGMGENDRMVHVLWTRTCLKR